ncbi:hypothetical protein NIES22_25880 [Calothrix brevissima NIES-22]|nr:hypothetical protein NIES22_25880 [Calothrix brevissima NIES-22]
MKAHRIKTILTEDGTLIVKDLPFQAGEAVEIIILESQTHPQPANPYPLRGKQPYRYDEPFEPAVPLEDWEVLQ